MDIYDKLDEIDASLDLLRVQVINEDVSDQDREIATYRYQTLIAERNRLVRMHQYRRPK